MTGKKLKAMPIGIEDFKRIIDEDCYLVDKSMMIKELIDDPSMVKLFTRPRRFGKTLNMSMIQYFFEKTSVKHEYAKLFDGLKISKYPEYIAKHQGQYPVINVSFKEMKDDTYELVYDTYKKIMKKEFLRHEEYVLNNAKLDVESKERYEKIINLTATESDYREALQFLSGCLEKAYGKQVIILIDEYDVPLEAAYMRGFYDKMVNLIRRVFSSALKTNNALHKGILTGCLRISKESIFTGFNNLKVYSILQNRYSTYFGFTEEEVTEMLDFYNLREKQDEVREWYNGYVFSRTKMYNPWSVLNYVDSCISGDIAPCASYWSNTSSNSIVKEMIQDGTEEIRDAIESLMNGETIESTISENITYGGIKENMDNIWSFLLFTGYLKQIGVRDNKIYKLTIPNKEIRDIYEDTIKNWFEKRVQSENRDEFFEAVLNKDVKKINENLQHWLAETISYYDERENYYHGFLAGLLSGFKGYVVKSNRESGNGRYDIFVLDKAQKKIAIIFEFKIARMKKDLESAADVAIKQIEDKNYEAELRQADYEKVFKYGIAFCEKKCYTKLSEYSD